jgi:hypothetical protein
MSQSKQTQKHALECLRLEADCRRLVWDVQSPSLRSHFLEMGHLWSVMAVSGPDSDEGFCAKTSMA